MIVKIEPIGGGETIELTMVPYEDSNLAIKAMVCREDNTWEFFYIYTTAKDYQVIPYEAVRKFIIDTGLFAEVVAIAAVWMHSVISVEQAMDEEAFVDGSGEWDAEDINQAFKEVLERDEDEPVQAEQDLIEFRDTHEGMLPAPTMMLT